MRRLQRFVPWAVAAGLAGGSISWIRRAGDFAGYLQVGELALQGRHIYGEAQAGINTWPPFFSLLCVPLALLARPSPYVARALWLALNWGLLWVSLRMLAELVYGVELRWRSDRGGLTLAAPAIFVPILLCYRFILGNFDHLQVNIVIFTCALGGLYWHARGRDVRAGILVGLAAALKVMPAVFVPYFLYRRRYRMALTAAAATTLLSLSPVLVYGWPRFVDYVASWRHAVEVGWGVGKMNQSVYAMFDRFIGHGITPFTATAVNALPESGDPRVTVATVAALALITLTALWVFRGREAPNSPVSLAEYSVVFIVSALFGPLAWKAYLVVLLCPCMLLVALARGTALPDRERRIVSGALVVYFVLAGLTTPGLLGKRLAGALEMLSVTTIGTLVIVATLLWLRPRLSGKGVAETAPESVHQA